MFRINKLFYRHLKNSRDLTTYKIYFYRMTILVLDNACYCLNVANMWYRLLNKYKELLYLTDIYNLPKCMLFMPCLFLRLIYYPTNSLRDTTHLTYINSYMFRHRDAILRELLQVRLISQPTNIRM
jgi:hypothetical protein